MTLVPANWTVSPTVRVASRTRASGRVAISRSPEHVARVEEGEHRGRVEVLEDLDADERGHNRLVDGSRHPLGAALRGDPLVAADDRDQDAEDDALDLAAVEVLECALGEEGAEEGAGVDADEVHRGEVPAEAGEGDHRDVVEGGHQRHRGEPGHHDEGDVADPHHRQRLELVAHLAGAEVGGDRRPACHRWAGTVCSHLGPVSSPSPRGSLSIGDATARCVTIRCQLPRPPRSRGRRGPYAPAMAPAPHLSVVIPTRNEAANLPVLVERLRSALDGIAAELCFVDDSDDDRPAQLEALAAASGGGVRCLLRRGAERAGGLSTAVVAGLRLATGAYVCVMDADLQHPPEVIPTM